MGSYRELRSRLCLADYVTGDGRCLLVRAVVVIVVGRCPQILTNVRRGGNIKPVVAEVFDNRPLDLVGRDVPLPRVELDSIRITDIGPRHSVDPGMWRPEGYAPSLVPVHNTDNHPHFGIDRSVSVSLSVLTVVYRDRQGRVSTPVLVVERGFGPQLSGIAVDTEEARVIAREGISQIVAFGVLRSHRWTDRHSRGGVLRYRARQPCLVGKLGCAVLRCLRPRLSRESQTDGRKQH